jgi:molybdenum cofactor cytidylyltransferase
MTQREPIAESNPVRTDGGRRVGAVLLAAGESTRFEAGNKLLADVEGTPIVRHAAETLTESAVDDVVVVVGYDEDKVRDALADLSVDFVQNTDYEDGQSTSVRVGVEVARERGWDATVFALGDMPFVRADSVDSLLDADAAGDGSIAAAAFEGKRGNPVLFDAKHYDALADVTGDMGGRQLVEEHAESALVETGDPGVTRDVDDEADLSKYTG